MDIRPPQLERRFSIIRRAKSFAHAGRGMWLLIRTTHNAWVQIFLLCFALLLGFLFHITHTEWMMLVLAAGLVLTAEAVNTALEVAVDLASPGEHPLARDVKDIAAGAVLIAAITALLIGLFIFVPYIAAA